MKIFYLTIALLLSVAVSFGQSNTVKGVVTDAESGDPLVGATIQVTNTNEVVVADADGKFQLSISESTDVTVRYVGYATYNGTIDPGANLARITLIPQILSESVVIKGIRADADDPVSQTTISAKTIETQFFGQDGAFLLERLTPSLVSFSESGTGFTNYGQMRLRGIDQTRINITLNGIPLNDMIDQGVFFSNFTDFGNSIESVQMQRGVGSSTNGTSSYAGSINFESVNLRDRPAGAEVQLQAGSFGTYRGSLEVSSGMLKDKFSFYSRISSIHSDGYRDHSGSDSYSLFFSGGYFGEKDIVKITGFTGRSRNELAYTPVWIEDIRRDPRTNYVSENDIDDFGQQFLQLQYTRFISTKTSITNSLYYGGAGGDFPFGFGDGAGGFTQINYPLYNNHYGLLSTLNFESDQLSFDGGIHAYTFRRVNEESIIPAISTPYYADESQKDEISGFAKAQYSFGKLKVSGDLQVRAVQLALEPDTEFLGFDASIPDRTWTFVNPKVGVSYVIDSRKLIYASLGRTGREPTRADILATSFIGPDNLAEVQNTNAVKAEYVNNLEVGTRISTDRYAINANVFYMDFENEIAPIGVFVPEIFGSLRENISNSQRYGVEIDLSVKPTDNIEFGGFATYMQGNIDALTLGGSTEVLRDREQILTPRWTAQQFVQYGRADWSIRLSGQYLSESFLELTNDPNLVLPSFFAANVQMNVSPFPWMDLQFAINNMFDEQYFTYGTPVDVDFDGVTDGPGYLLQPPRNGYVLMKIKI